MEGTTAAVHHIVVFRLGQQAFAFSIAPVHQMIDMVSILPLPKADPLIEGILNYHGRMVPVIDMHRLMYGTACPRGLHTPILLVNIDTQLTGLIVEEIVDVNSVPADQIAAPVDFLPAGVRPMPILRGITNIAGAAVMLLDLDSLFEAGQAQALAQMAAALEAFYRQLPQSN